jgi:hypothetical protein
MGIRAASRRALTVRVNKSFHGNSVFHTCVLGKIETTPVGLPRYEKNIHHERGRPWRSNRHGEDRIIAKTAAAAEGQ